MLPLFIGLGIAWSWGMADIASSHTTISPSRSTVIAQGSGMLVLIFYGIFVPMEGISFSIDSLSTALLIVLGLGCASALGYASLYRAFQSPLSVALVSALVASHSAVSTLLAFLVFRDVSLWSILFILSGVILIATTIVAPGSSPRRGVQTCLARHPCFRGMLWAMMASLCLGCFNFGLGLVSSMTQAWYPLLLGSRAVSLLLLSFVLAGSRDGKEKDHPTFQKNMLLAVAIGVTEMLGLLGLCFSTERDEAHLTMILAISSCSVLLPVCYGICRGMRLSLIHVFSLILILFGLVTLKDVQISSLSLMLFVVSLVVWVIAFVLSWIFKRKRTAVARAYEATSKGIDRPKDSLQGEDLSCHIMTKGRTVNARTFVSSASLLQSPTSVSLSQAKFVTVKSSEGNLRTSPLVESSAILESCWHSPYGRGSLGASVSHYLWLLPDQQNDEAQPLLVGNLSSLPPVVFPQIANRQNWRANLSRVLLIPIALVPLLPLMENVTSLGWIPDTPTHNDLKLLEHLRHLLVCDPTLVDNSKALSLDIWLYWHTGKVLRWSTTTLDLIMPTSIQWVQSRRGGAARVVDLALGWESKDPQESINLFLSRVPPGLLSRAPYHVPGLPIEQYPFRAGSGYAIYQGRREVPAPLPRSPPTPPSLMPFFERCCLM